MGTSARKILSSAALLSSREHHMERLERLFADERLGGPFMLSGYNAQSEVDPFLEPERWAEDAAEDLARNADKLLDPNVFRPLSMQYWLYGVHFIDKLFGADVYWQNGQWWSHGLTNEIGELPDPDLDHNPTWAMAKRLTLAMVRSAGDAPFITTQVLGEPLNQAVNLYKERLLLGFYDEPEGVKRDLRLITDTILRMHNWFREHFPADQFQPIVPDGRCQPRGMGQMCGCSTHLISGALYRAFCASLDEEILELYPRGGMLHLCGAHTQHLSTWREMRWLRAIQLNDRASHDLADFYTQLREDQILYVYPDDQMTIKQALEITEGGNRLVLCLSELEVNQLSDLSALLV